MSFDDRGRLRESLIGLIEDVRGAVLVFTRKLHAEAYCAEDQAALAEHQLKVATEDEETKRKESEPKGTMKAPFGYCPDCGEVGVSRDLHNQQDGCKNGHLYPSGNAVSITEMRRRERFKRLKAIRDRGTNERREKEPQEEKKEDNG